MKLPEAGAGILGEEQSTFASVEKHIRLSTTPLTGVLANLIAHSGAVPGSLAWRTSLGQSSMGGMTWLEQAKRASDSLSPALKWAQGYKGGISHLVTQFDSKFRKHAEDLGEVSKIIEEYPARVGDALVLMAQYGWYLDSDMGLYEPIRFKNAVDEGDLERANQSMVGHFSGRARQIELELCRAFPVRAHLFAAAFQAHSNGQYIVAIPVLFAQVDGICGDLANGTFFERSKRDKVVQAINAGATSKVAKAFVLPLGGTLAVSMSQKDRQSDFDGLNRHLVLHGESIDYGTELNSLRAISFLNYIAQALLREYADDEDEP